MVMFSFNLLFSHKGSICFEVINSLFMGQTDFFPSGPRGTHLLTNFFPMGDLEVTLPGPIRFVMSSQSHVHLANETAPIDGGHSVLFARSRIFKWRFTCGSQGSRIRETNLSRPIQVTKFQAALFCSNSFVGCLGLRPIQKTGLTFGGFGNLCANLTLPSLGILRTDLQLPWFFLVPACLDKRLRIEQLVLPRKTPWFCHI